MAAEDWLAIPDPPHGTRLTRETEEDCEGWWAGELQEGEQLWTLIQAGGHVLLTGAGETVEVAFPNSAWVHIQR
eukprot:12195608-Prorocentrum_lima.AAC.1